MTSEVDGALGFDATGKPLEKYGLYWRCQISLIHIGYNLANDLEKPTDNMLV